MPNGRVQARAEFRDFDGRIRLVLKAGTSRAAAERALKIELAERRTPGTGSAILASTRVAELATLWLDAPHSWSTGTERTYRSVVRNQVVPALGDLRLQEVTAGTVTRAIRAIAERHGPSAAKSARGCLSGMFALAVEDCAVPMNPVRDSLARISVDKKSPRALTPEETSALVGWLRAPLLDLEANTWEVNATVVRVPRVGLIVQRARRPPPAGVSSPCPTSRPLSYAAG